MINSRNEVNAIYPSFVKKLGFLIRPTEIEIRWINSTTLDTYGMVVVVFLMIGKANQVRFFEKIFLVANISPEVVLGMPFLTLSGANVNFLGRELW